MGDYALKHFDKDLVEKFSLKPLDVDPIVRGQFY